MLLVLKVYTFLLSGNALHKSLQCVHWILLLIYTEEANTLILEEMFWLKSLL